MTGLSWPLATKKCCAGRGGGQEHHTACSVHGYWRPDIAPAAQPRPCLRRRRIELPEQRASPDIERAHGGAGRVGARHVVDRGADDQRVVQHRRRRIERKLTGVVLRRRVRKRHRALVAELGAGASRREVEFDHPRV
jgi:hypothetical protein